MSKPLLMISSLLKSVHSHVNPTSLSYAGKSHNSPSRSYSYDRATDNWQGIQHPVLACKDQFQPFDFVGRLCLSRLRGPRPRTFPQSRHNMHTFSRKPLKPLVESYHGIVSLSLGKLRGSHNSSFVQLLNTNVDEPLASHPSNVSYGRVL